MPWNESLYHLEEHGGENGKLCFGFMWDDGVVKPHAPYYRAMEMTKRALIDNGHEVVDWKAYKALEGGKMLVRLCGPN
jgi:amidase